MNDWLLANRTVYGLINVRTDGTKVVMGALKVIRVIISVGGVHAMNDFANSRFKSLAVSLSGGGHRATLFVLGTLMYLVDAKANAHVTSIASVSGGSLTNGFVGQTLNFRETDGSEFRKRVAGPLATQIAKSGTLFAPLFTKVYLLVLIAGALLVLAIPAIVSGPWYVRLLLFFVGLTVWGWLFGARGRVCARAFRITLFSANSRETTLRELKKTDLDHVICATEFRSAEQVYFSGEFVYSYALGYGGPAELSLARAVQASAAFPGGFPPATLPTKQHKFTGAPPPIAGGPPNPPAEMVLTDGGVYDNMGEQWARGFAARVKRCPSLGTGRTDPNQLVVVNASARIPWIPFRKRLIPLIGELAALIRVNNVLYINTTNVRRQAIVDSYNPADPATASALPSALVQIAQSPFVVASAFANGTTAVAERAKRVLEFLMNGPTSDEWTKIARENSAVATSLSKIGTEVSARLIYQGYVVTMCNLHVLFGTDFPLLPEALAIERFRELIR
ncbi:MAG TPA: patatin-like phospholipase family protein [Pyrinomonadaceae bacterium]|nr:patatin-like phospholipase family protein [Pyrinomonadaceae bacterium]